MHDRGFRTPPVVEVIDDETHGLLADFFDVDGLAARAAKALRDPGLVQETRGRGPGSCGRALRTAALP